MEQIRQAIRQMISISDQEMETFLGQCHNRVPQHMIASYLGVTPVHLSRLKKEQ